MNVAQLRKAIAHLPDDMPVAIQAECGWSDVNLYVTPASIDQRYSTGGYLSDEHVDTSREIYSKHINVTALLISEWGHDGEDITPRELPVIDAEIAPLGITGETA